MRRDMFTRAFYDFLTPSGKKKISRLTLDVKVLPSYFDECITFSRKLERSSFPRRKGSIAGEATSNVSIFISEIHVISI